MFDIGWTEMLVIAVVMIVVVGPKDLPKMLRTFGRTTAKMRAMAGDFQKQFNEALREAELDDVRKSVESLRSLNPANEVRKQLNPLEKAAAEVRAGVDSAMRPASKPADPARAVEAEPLKGGAACMPGGETTPVAAAAAPKSPRKDAASARATATKTEPKPAASPSGKTAEAAPKASRKKKTAGTGS